MASQNSDDVDELALRLERLKSGDTDALGHTDDEIWQRYSGLREDGVSRAKHNQHDLVLPVPQTETEQIDLLLVQMADKVALAGKAKLVSKVSAGSSSATDSALAARLNALHASSSQQSSSSAQISPVEDRGMAVLNDEDEETLVSRIIAQVTEDIALERKHGVDLGEHPHDQHRSYVPTQLGESDRSDDSESSSDDSNFSDLEELLDIIDT